MAFSAAFLLALSLLALRSCCCHGAGPGTVTAIYSLGDSITDTGNLIKEVPPGEYETIRHLPYGVTMGAPTGRFSDGLLMIDFLAQDLGLPLLNPYLGTNKTFDHGVNFAVAGATAMDIADRSNNLTAPRPSSLSVQLRWFKDFMKSRFKTDQEIRKKLQSSLVLVGEIGGNDYNYPFFGHEPVTKVEKLIPGVVQTIIEVAKQVLDMGASKVIIPGNFPIGCVPAYLALNANSSKPNDYDPSGCLRWLNGFAAKHNTELQRAVAELQKTHPGASIAYADYFDSFLAVLHNASAFGFDAASTLRACCGAGGGKYNFDMERTCGVQGTTVCANPSAYLSWDGIHMTQAGYRAMSRLIYHGKYLQPQILSFPASGKT